MENMSEDTQGTEEETQLEAGQVEITVNSPKTDRSVTFIRNFGKDLAESENLFGAEVVHSVFCAQAVIRAQGAARTLLDNGEKGGEDAVAAGEAYTPGVVRRGGGGKKKDPYAVLAAQIQAGTLTQEQLMAELQKRMDASNASS